MQVKQRKPRPWYIRKRVLIPAAAVVAFLAIGALSTPAAKQAPAGGVDSTLDPNWPGTAAPTAGAAPTTAAGEGLEVGSRGWLLNALRTAEGAGGFQGATDEQLVSIADKSCEHRRVNGPSGAELARMAAEAGFTPTQAEAISTQTYVYCTAQEQGR